MNRAAFALFVAFVAIVIAACSASAGPIANDAGSDAGLLGECPPPTALLPITGSKNIWPNSAVPRGSCPGATTCEMLIDECCHPVFGADPIDRYTCQCQSGVWQCTVVRGTSVCADLDAGDFPSCPETGS